MWQQCLTFMGKQNKTPLSWKENTNTRFKMFRGQRKHISIWYLLKSVVYWRQWQPHKKRMRKHLKYIYWRILRAFEPRNQQTLELWEIWKDISPVSHLQVYSKGRRKERQESKKNTEEKGVENQGRRLELTTKGKES